MGDAKTVRMYAAVIMTVLICIIFVVCLGLAYAKGDTAMQQLLVGVAAGAFSTAVSFCIGSSASSAQKDDQLSQQQATTATRGPSPG